jgi:hypothetical protein
MPRTAAEWMKVGKRFHAQWNFPQCCGALDGKHIAIKKPARSGAAFYNYKGFYSIVLLALVDADYCFQYVNIGANGRAGDGGVFDDCTLSTVLDNDLIGFPADHVIVADDAFPLKMYMMKRYPINTKVTKEKIFNYRLSRARNIVENAFGILACRFRLFLRPIKVKVETVEKAVWAACTLHNWLRKSSPGFYFNSVFVDRDDFQSRDDIPGVWRSTITGLPSIKHSGSNNYRRSAEVIRDNYATYFCSEEGMVPWQWKKVGLPDTYFCEEEEEEDVDGDLEAIT